MNLVSAAERLSSIDRSALAFDARRCLHTQDRSSACQACFEICPVQAIQASRPPVFDAARCAGCLACLPACPVGAYAADDAVRALLACVPRLETPHLELVCARHAQAGLGCRAGVTAIRVHGCLAGLGAGALLTLAAMGLESVTLRTDACAGCAWGKLHARLEEQIAEARQLLSAWGKADLLAAAPTLEDPQERPLWDAHNPPLSRRDLFRLASRQGLTSLGRALEPAHTGAGRQPGRDHRRTQRAVEQLSPASALHDPLLPAGKYAWLEISEACTACGVCGRACPTGALAFSTDPEETKFQLTFAPQACTACELCAHVCAPDAIRLRPAPSMQQVFGAAAAPALRQGALAHCEVCKSVYAAAPDTFVCPACSFRRKSPFGSRIPPSLQKTPDPLSMKRQL